MGWYCSCMGLGVTIKFMVLGVCACGCIGVQRLQFSVNDLHTHSTVHRCMQCGDAKKIQYKKVLKKKCVIISCVCAGVCTR